MSDESKILNLQFLLNDVESKELLLPDFQRKFVWDKEDMCGLFASILCKVPLGSILTLESDDQEFSCKKFGAKPREIEKDVQAGKLVKYLIDGQQRITSMFAGFTTYYYSAFKEDCKKIAAGQLLEMYFLKIPALSNKDSQDIFKSKTLSFDCNWSNEGTAYFSTEEMKKIIETKKVSSIIQDKKNEMLDIESKEDLDKIFDYCTANHNGYYLIPLQFALYNKGPVSQTFSKILDRIAIAFSNSDDDEDVRREWANNVRDYIRGCLSSLQLHHIPVKKTDKARAIDIYTNLNKGGIALSVFDLIMAKVGKLSQENFYDTLIGYIQEKRKYPKKIVNSQLLQVSVPKDFCATTNAEITNDKDEIVQEYINNFLNILSLYIAHKKGKPFSTDSIKQNAILNLEADDIVKNSPKICEAMDRALFFFQTRCGIRKLSDINYKAEFTLVAYFFTDDKLFGNEKAHNLLEYWYWISLFAHLYQSNQNVAILSEIPLFEEYFSNSRNKQILNRLDEDAKRVLKVDRFTNKQTLTMEQSKKLGIMPVPVMTKYICQFYLAVGYCDFFDTNININYLYQDPLQIHHLLPLGSDPNLKIGESTKQLRKEKDNPYNSPLNMLFITNSSNNAISDWPYSKYIKDERIRRVLNTVGCMSGSETESEITIDKFLSERYYQLDSDLNKRLKKLRDSLK